MKPIVITKPQAKSKTNWKKVKALADKDIDYSDIPTVTPELFAKAVLKKGGLVMKQPKRAISLRVDSEVLEWFKAQGEGYQSHINAVLEAYVQAQKSSVNKR